MRTGQKAAAILVAALLSGTGIAAPYPAVENGVGIFIDGTGRRVFSQTFQRTASFSEGLAFVQVNEETAVVNLLGQIVLKLPGLTPGSPFHEGLAIVGTPNGKMGAIDTTGKLVVPAVFDALSPFSGGLSAARNGEWGGFITRDGSWHITPHFMDPGMFAEERASVRVGDKYGFIDPDGNTVVAAEFADVGFFEDGLAPVKTGRKWGYVDRDGKMAIAARFDAAAPFHDGFAVIELDGLCGLIDMRGNVVLAPKFAAISVFCEGRAAARLDDKWGVIDPNGRVIVPFIYDQVDEFQDGLVHVVKKGPHGEESSYLDRQGKTVFPQPAPNEK